MRLRSSRVATAVIAFGLSALVGVAISAQGQARGQAGGRGGPPQNLQVLPKDWTLQQVQQTMRTVAGALGVECSHCHVSQADRASDAKPQKVTARKMLQMTMAINNELLEGIGDPAPAGTSKVTCFTCHRGVLKPLTAPAAGGF
jgi:hypothetical protein